MASLPYSATRTSRCQISCANESAAINTSHQGLMASRTSPSTNSSSASSKNWRHISSWTSQAAKPSATAAIYIIRIACGDSSVTKTHWHTSSHCSWSIIRTAFISQEATPQRQNSSRRGTVRSSRSCCLIKQKGCFSYPRLGKTPLQFRNNPLQIS